MYVAMDPKSENMICLKIVKTSKEAEALGATEDEGGLHGTKVLKELIEPLAFTNLMVCADSFLPQIEQQKNY
jgi:hypothetical protein